MIKKKKLTPMGSIVTARRANQDIPTMFLNKLEKLLVRDNFENSKLAIKCAAT